MAYMIPDQLKTMLEEAGLSHAEVISFGERKGRWCLSAVNEDGVKVFVKWNDPDKEEFYKSFKKEIVIYSILQGTGVVPVLFETGAEDLLVLEYKEGKGTLRSLLLGEQDPEIKKEFLKKAMILWDTFLVVSDERKKMLAGMCTETSYPVQFEHHLWQLYLSGPADTRINRVTRKINQFYLAADRRKNGIPERGSMRKTVIHGDLHLNNFMIDETGITLIDFEDVTAGCAEVELAYFAVQAEALLKDEKTVRDSFMEDMKNIFGKRLDMKAWQSIYSRYRTAILHNPRFLRGKS